MVAAKTGAVVGTVQVGASRMFTAVMRCRLTFVQICFVMSIADESQTLGRTSNGHGISKEIRV